MPISSYVLRCMPEDQPAVREQLNRMVGLEVGDATATGIPVAAEADTTKSAQAIGDRLQQLNGVKSAVLVYHNFEDVMDEAPDRARL